MTRIHKSRRRTIATSPLPELYRHCSHYSARLFSFSSAPRLCETPQKSRFFLSGDSYVHQSLQGPFLFVFFHLRRWPLAPRFTPGGKPTNNSPWSLCSALSALCVMNPQSPCVLSASALASEVAISTV